MYIPASMQRGGTHDQSDMYDSWNGIGCAIPGQNLFYERPYSSVNGRFKSSQPVVNPAQTAINFDDRSQLPAQWYTEDVSYMPNDHSQQTSQWYREDGVSHMPNEDYSPGVPLPSLFHTPDINTTTIEYRPRQSTQWFPEDNVAYNPSSKFNPGYSPRVENSLRPEMNNYRARPPTQWFAGDGGSQYQEKSFWPGSNPSELRKNSRRMSGDRPPTPWFTV